MTTPEDPNQPYGTPPPGSMPPPPPYGAPPPPYGAPPPAYGAQPPAYGAPPPAYGGTDFQTTPYGAPPGGYNGPQLAAWIERVGATLIDALIIAVPAAIIGVAAGSRVIEQVLGGIGQLVFAFLNGAQGQTPGKRVLHIKCLRESDGQLIGGGMGIVRAIAHILDAIPCLIGYLWPLWDSKNQTFADKIVGTVVVKV
jgi:uncharacterized RDD family membrane protein YckC